MYGYVYETTCLINGKKYIGMHKWDKPEIDNNYLGSGLLLKQAIKKYGKENFSCKILLCCDSREELSKAERELISKTKAPINEQYYNIEDGGFGGHSEFCVQPITENQLKALENGRKKPASDKLKSTLRNYRLNVVVTEETRKKLSENQLGRRCVNNGSVNKYIKQDELDKYLSEGWKLGKYVRNRMSSVEKFKSTHRLKTNEEILVWKNKLSVALSGRKWITDGTHNKLCSEDELQKYLSNGWTFGRVIGKFND